MRITMFMPAAVLALLACPGSAGAHHAGSMYVTTPTWIKGTVVRFERINPHTITMLEERGPDGQVHLWAVEGPARFQLDRRDTGRTVPKAGDVITFCAFAYKPVEELSRMFPDADFSGRQLSPDSGGTSPRHVSGHVMVMPDGEKRLWEPHGVLSACIRSADDQRQSWLDFLNTDQHARQAWCEQRRYALVQTNESLREFVEEINGLIDNPCE